MNERQGRSRRMVTRLPVLLASGESAAAAWPLILPIFLAGTVTTAVGLTIAPHDTTVMAGMVLTGIAVVAMWLPGKGFRLSTTAIMLAFVLGSACTAMALTVSPSNGLFLAGMVLTGAGIIGMWAVGKSGRLAQATGTTFMAGISAQGVGLTVAPSDALVLAGMVLVGTAVFGMWVYSNR